MTPDELYHEYSVDDKARDKRPVNEKPHISKAGVEGLKFELKSMTKHYHIAKDNEEKQILTNRVLQDRINILNGMLDKAYDEIKQLKKLQGCSKCEFSDLSIRQAPCDKCRNGSNFKQFYLPNGW